jgi:hypothetical protein
LLLSGSWPNPQAAGRRELAGALAIGAKASPIAMI